MRRVPALAKAGVLREGTKEEKREAIGCLKVGLRVKEGEIEIGK
jgi:hypothetical protein